MLRWPAGLILGVFCGLFVGVGLMNRVMIGSVMLASSVLIWAGLILYGCKVLVTATMGDMDPPHWPEVGFRTQESLPLARVAAVIAVCLAPFFFVTVATARGLGQGEFIVAMAYAMWPTELVTGDYWRTFEFRGLTWWSLLSLLAGLAYAPAAVLATAIRDDARGFFPRLAARVITRAAPAYAMCLLPMGAYLLLAAILSHLLHLLGPLIVGVILDATLPYVILVQFRMTGLLYAFHERELDLLGE